MPLKKNRKTPLQRKEGCVCVCQALYQRASVLHLTFCSEDRRGIGTPWQTQCNEAMPWSGKQFRTLNCVPVAIPEVPSKLWLHPWPFQNKYRFPLQIQKLARPLEEFGACSSTEVESKVCVCGTDALTVRQPGEGCELLSRSLPLLSTHGCKLKTRWSNRACDWNFVRLLECWSPFASSP